MTSCSLRNAGLRPVEGHRGATGNAVHAQVFDAVFGAQRLFKALDTIPLDWHKPNCHNQACGLIALTTRVMKAYFSRILLVLAAACSTTSATTRYVDLNCPTPTPPYTNWATAATTIQDAVDAVNGVDLILVTNGVYASGGRSVLAVSNRVAVTRPGITIQSVNGPEQTIIQGCQAPGTTNGPGAVRCVYLGGNAVLSGFTLTNGATLASGDEYNAQSGGGVRATSQSAVVTNCVITGSSASWYGGGVYGYGTLNNCLLIGNSAYIGGGAGATTSGSIWLVNSRVQANSAGLGGGLYNVDAHGSVLTDNSADQGGGASGGQLVQCTVTRNRARIGAGTASSMLGNSIVYFNFGLNYYSSTFRYCCTTPLPVSGPGNISVDPQLASTWRLSASSPCRGVGLQQLRHPDGHGRRGLEASAGDWLRRIQPRSSHRGFERSH